MVISYYTNVAFLKGYFMNAKKLLWLLLTFLVLSLLLIGCDKAPQHTKVTKTDGEYIDPQGCQKKGHSFENGSCIRCDAVYSDALEFELGEDRASYVVKNGKNCKDNEVIIPSEYNGLPVTVIGESAFYYSSTARSVSIPSTVETIEESAFHRCKNLVSIIFEENSSLRYIGDDAFLFCDSLLYVDLPESLENIGAEAFRGCYLLKAIKLRDNIMHIGNDAFTGTEYYRKSENWENGILYIDNYLIAVNTSFSGKCVVKDGVRLLADEAFSACSYLKIVDLPITLEVIGDGTFSNCYSLERINFPMNNNLKVIYERAFAGCESFLRISYSKSKDDWMNVDKKAMWDYYMGNYIIHCYDGDISK